MNRVIPKLPCLISLFSVFLILGCSAESPPFNEVATSDIIVGGSVIVFEETDVLEFSVDLSTIDSGEKVQIGTTDERYELQTLQSDGTYKLNETEAVFLGVPFYRLKDYKAPITHRIMLFRANGEEFELLKVDVKTKFRSSLFTDNLSHGNNDSLSFEFALDSLESSFDFSGRIRADFITTCSSVSHNFLIDEIVAYEASVFPYEVTSKSLLPDSISSDEFPCETAYSSLLAMASEQRTSTISAQVGSALENAGDTLNVEIWPTWSTFTITE